MNLRPIRNEEDYETALEEIETLWAATPGTSEADRLDVLVLLVEAYEAEQYPIPAPDPIELILHVMEARGLKRRDLEPYLGSRARVSEVLNRRRLLSRNDPQVAGQFGSSRRLYWCNPIHLWAIVIQ